LKRWPTWWYCNIKEYFPDWDFATVESPKSKYPLPIYYQYLLDNYRAEIQLQDALENVIEGYQAPSWYWRRAESFGLVAIDITQRFKREAYFNVGGLFTCLQIGVGWEIASNVLICCDHLG
jgi:hypothetical protein